MATHDQKGLSRRSFVLSAPPLLAFACSPAPATSDTESTSATSSADTMSSTGTTAGTADTTGATGTAGTTSTTSTTSPTTGTTTGTASESESEGTDTSIDPPQGALPWLDVGLSGVAWDNDTLSERMPPTPEIDSGDLYVDIDGGDDGADGGGWESPLKTLQEALSRVIDGQTIVVTASQGGVLALDDRISRNESWSQGIVVAARQDLSQGPIVVDCGGVIGKNPIRFLGQREHWIGFEFIHGNLGITNDNTNSGVIQIERQDGDTHDSSFTKIERCVFRDNWYSGIQVYRADDVDVVDCLFYGFNSDGVIDGTNSPDIYNINTAPNQPPARRFRAWRCCFIGEVGGVKSRMDDLTDYFGAADSGEYNCVWLFNQEGADGNGLKLGGARDGDGLSTQGCIVAFTEANAVSYNGSSKSKTVEHLTVWDTAGGPGYDPGVEVDMGGDGSHTVRYCAAGHPDRPADHNVSGVDDDNSWSVGEEYAPVDLAAWDFSIPMQSALADAALEGQPLGASVEACKIAKYYASLLS